MKRIPQLRITAIEGARAGRVHAVTCVTWGQSEGGGHQAAGSFGGKSAPLKGGKNRISDLHHSACGGRAFEAAVTHQFACGGLGGGGRREQNKVIHGPARIFGMLAQQLQKKPLRMFVVKMGARDTQAFKGGCLIVFRAADAGDPGSQFFPGLVLPALSIWTP